MNCSKVVAIAFFAIAILGSPPHRSVTPIAPDETQNVGFYPTHSAALFVGVQQFDHHWPEVPFGVDDAVDLAHLFAFDRHVRLVSPQRIVLAIAGLPKKPESRQRLDQLVCDGARVTSASESEILARLDEQAALAGNGGLLIVSFATHGFLRDGIQHVLGASGNAISTAQISDVIDAHSVPRSLLLIDACHVRGVAKGRGVIDEAEESVRLTKRMRNVHGQVVLSTVGPAYDDPVRRNGVFTESVIDGLQCNATTIRDDVTPQTLITYVDQSVHAWIRKNVDSTIRSATQMSVDSDAKNMPLAHCGPPPSVPLTVLAKATHLRVYSNHPKKLLWERDVGGPVAHVTQIDGTIIAAVQENLIAFHSDGTQIWSICGHVPLHAITSGDLFRRHHHHVVALWGSQIAIYDAEGNALSMCDTGEPLRNVAILRTTPRHAPRIVVASANRVLLFDPKKLAKGKPIWSAHLSPRSATIKNLNVVDHDRDTRSEIEITTTDDDILYVDVKGRVIEKKGNVRLNWSR